MLSTLQSCVLLFQIRLKLLILAWPVVEVEKGEWGLPSIYRLSFRWNKTVNWIFYSELFKQKCWTGIVWWTVVVATKARLFSRCCLCLMQIYTLVTPGWRIKDHPWNVTCVWSSRPERGTASISAGQGQEEMWNQAVDALRKTGLEQCCDHWVGGLKVFF